MVRRRIRSVVGDLSSSRRGLCEGRVSPSVLGVPGSPPSVSGSEGKSVLDEEDPDVHRTFCRVFQVPDHSGPDFKPGV